MGSYFSREAEQEENHEKEIAKLKMKAYAAERERELHLVIMEEKKKTQEASTMAEILTTKKEIEFEVQRHILKKTVEIAKNIQINGEDPEKFTNIYLSACELADRRKIHSGLKQIDNDVAFTTDVTVFRKA